MIKNSVVKQDITNPEVECVVNTSNLSGLGSTIPNHCVDSAIDLGEDAIVEPSVSKPKLWSECMKPKLWSECLDNWRDDWVMSDAEIKMFRSQVAVAYAKADDNDNNNDV